MVGKDQGLRYLCLNSSQLVNSWRAKEDPSSYSKRTRTISELFIVKLSVRYIYIINIITTFMDPLYVLDEKFGRPKKADYSTCVFLLRICFRVLHKASSR
jgi:hypothetical protein